MRYIDAIKGGTFSLLLFGILAIYISGKGFSDDIELVLTITTFLFAILIILFS